MKSLLPIVAASAGAGAVTALLVAPLVWGPPTGSAAAEPVTLVDPAPAPSAEEAPAPAAALLPADWLDRLTSIEDRLAALELRPAESRTPVASLQPNASPNPGVVEPAELQMIVNEAINADFERRERDREERRDEAQREWIDQRADRLAEELGLGSADRDRLADVLFGESERRSELMEELRETGPVGDMRERFREIRTWTESELTAQLGADVAEQVLERDRRRFFGGPGGGPGGGGGDDPGGGRPRGGRPR